MGTPDRRLHSQRRKYQTEDGGLAKKWKNKNRKLKKRTRPKG